MQTFNENEEQFERIKDNEFNEKHHNKKSFGVSIKTHVDNIHVDVQTVDTKKTGRDV